MSATGTPGDRKASGGAPGPAQTDQEAARPDASGAAAVPALAKDGRQRAGRGRARRLLAAVLVVAFAVLLPVTILATWAHRTVANADAYVATVAPIAASPAVQAAVSAEITDEIYAALNPQQAIAAALPPKAAGLAGPLSAGIKGYLQDITGTIVASPAFRQLWAAANRFADTQLIRVLNGDTKALQTTNGQVVLNLVPLLNQALKSVQAQAPGLFGKNVTLPDIGASSGNPAADCQKIAAAIRHPLPPGCGQIPLFPAKALTGARRAYRAFNGIVLVLLILTPLVFIAALWASTRRRRTLLQLCIGGMLGLIVARRAVYWLQSDLTAAAKPANQAALGAITGQVLHGFFNVTLWFLVGGLVVLAVVLLAGPYRWAAAARSWLRRAVGHASGGTTAGWARRHLDLLRIGGLLIGALAVLVFSVSWAGTFIIIALVALYELGVSRLRPASPTGAGARVGGQRPQNTVRRARWLARAAFLLVLAAVADMIGFAGLRSLAMVGIGAAGACLVLAGGYVFLARRGVPRGAALAVVILAPVAVLVIFSLHRLVSVAVVAVALILLAIVAARQALTPAADPGMPAAEVPPPRHPFLIMNPRSGGGKVARFGLKDKAEALGAEVALLDGPGTVDVAALARQAVADGADLLGVAGGDGTQALVAGIAAEHDLPFLVISAGTRNHFALDLGLDREDPAACLDALTDGVEQRIDLGVIGGRTFVNNASFGAYAEIVESPAYRDDKRGTTLQVLPDLLAGHRGATLTARAGAATITGPQALLVSNNPYGMTDIAGLGHRARLDAGTLGVVAVTVTSAVRAVGLLGGGGVTVLTAGEVVVDANEPQIPVGIDGETVMMPTPVRCVIQPRALRVRVPRDRPGVRPPKPALDWATLRQLASFRPAPAGAEREEMRA